METFSFPEDLKNINDVNELNNLSFKIRNKIISIVSKNGGHLSSNLGSVEATISMLKVFGEKDDCIVWDVGHQCYTYKILTGRNLESIRTKGGLSGFTSQDESYYDKFKSGHAGNSISLALGLSEYKIKEKKNGKVVVFIGDGAMTCGLAYEGLNNACFANNLIIILNDNSMSISKNVGSISKYLSKIRTNDLYLNLKFNIKYFLDKVPILGKKISNRFSDLNFKLRSLVFNKGSLFENLGFRYYGPVDGHNIFEMMNVMKIAKRSNFPVLIHIVSKKGKGYLPAELNPEKFHGVAKSNNKIKKSKSFSDEFGRIICDFASKNDKIYAITAAMKEGVRLTDFSQKFSERFCDVGIAESHAVSFAAGLSAAGYLPVFAVYSTFLQRSFDQIINDVLMQNLKIILAIDRAGLIGEDGESHQGIFDVPMLNSAPGIVCYSPSFLSEMENCFNIALSCENLIAIRYPKGSDFFKPNWIKNEINDFEFYGNSKKTLIITYGRIFSFACQMLENFPEQISILKLTKIIPLSVECILKSCEYEKILFFEESYKSGSISDKFASLLLQNKYKGIFKSVAIDGFIKHATVDEQLYECMLDFQSMKSFYLSQFS